MARDPYKYFRLEARDLLAQFGAGVLEIEKRGNSAEQIQRLLRLAHTLKGAARVIKQPAIAERAHAIEDALAPFREASENVPRDCIDTILKHVDDIEERILALAPGEAATVAVRNAPTAEDGSRSVRADVAEMDALLDGIVETHTLLNKLRSVPQSIERAQRLTGLLVAQLATRPTQENVHSPFIGSDRAKTTAEDLLKSFRGVTGQVGTAVDQMDRELRQLRDAAEQLRLVAAGSLFTALERLARDAAATLGKQVVFEGVGGDIRLDAHVLSGVQGALVQIVRNAVAHGVESTNMRRAAGKPIAGRITLDVSRRGRQILFRCGDDGAGVDLDAVGRVAARRGLLGSGTDRLSAEALMGLLLRGGISTSESVTETAGRGVGLDVVREAIEQLGGKVAVRTEAGNGTIFELIVPFSVASLDALVIEAHGSVVTIPLDAVRTSMRVASDQVSWGSSGASMLYDQKAIPFISLPRALFGARPATERSLSVIVLAGVGGLAAVGVDRLLGTARVVVRPLSQLMPATAMVAGASLDAEGNPQLVLDPDGIVAEAQRGFAAELEPIPSRLPVLVVDDSLTTRMLEQSILESAGYEVDIVASGEDGIESVHRKQYSLILVDVEMPGMDGFTFVERIRSDPATHEIPAILVTSRAAPEDLERGQRVGAQGYVIKSEFDQAKLLATIRSLTG